MIKTKWFILIFLVAVAITLMFVGNNKSSDKIDNNQENIAQPAADKIQVFLFHNTLRCITCINIGKYSKETVEEYFQPEIRDGKIEFREINIDLAENKDLAQKFQASGSALFINTIYDNQDHISENTDVWRLTGNKQEFKNYLRYTINQLYNK